MSLINREDLIAEYDRVHVGPPGGARKLIEEAPEVKPKVVAEIKIDNDALQRMANEAVEQIKAELFGNSEQLDTISRQAAIDALDVLCQEHRYKIPGKRETYSQYNEAWQDALDRAEGAIFNLPPAQPEIIRCKDCAYWQREWSDEKDYHYCTMEDDRTYREFYCANAERT